MINMALNIASSFCKIVMSTELNKIMHGQHDTENLSFYHKNVISAGLTKLANSQHATDNWFFYYKK